MKKLVVFLIAALVLTGCGKIEYEQGMFSDVTKTDSFEEAVAFCFNERYITGEDGYFGSEDAVTLSEFADILAKMKGTKKSGIEFVLEENIAPLDFPDWDTALTNENCACMLSNAFNFLPINQVITGSIKDAEESYAKDAIYQMYRAGIFDGNEYFSPFDFVNKSEMAVIVQRCVDKEKRARFAMDYLQATFIAFGDTISHSPVIKSGKTNEGYDFMHLFSNVKPYIDNADISCVNQETVFTSDGFSGYPSFGGPEEFGIAEAESGFDVVTHATNHAFDRGEKGVLYTTAFWKKYPHVTMLGMHESKEDADEISVINVNGIKIALLNYTYSLNGFVLPKGKEYLVDLLDEDKIISDMTRAREMSDAIVVFAHWGNEYQNSPSEEQKNWAQLFADNGADVIVGHHPHVVQKLDYVVNKFGESIPVYYSLGNFISSQNDYQTALCAMADFKIVKDFSGTRCENATIEPVVTHMQMGDYTAYLLKDYPEEKLLRHKHRGKFGERFSKEKYLELFNEIMNK